MSWQASDDGGAVFSFSGPDAVLKFRKSAGNSIQPTVTDLFWKIGITVGNLDQAVAWLDANEWPVSRPRQFRDIGYLCHLRDPESLSIELLQRGFEGNHSLPIDAHPFADATLAHLTLRCTDLSAMRRYCEKTLGLRLMSVQPVEDVGFTLYFYCNCSEALPNPDLKSVDNREWLWSRPYTILEIQHLQQVEGRVRFPKEGDIGFFGFAFDSGLSVSVDNIGFE